MNIRLLRPADFNIKLRERGVDKRVTVQKICKVSKNEKDVRIVLDEIWQNSSKAQEILVEALMRNPKCVRVREDLDELISSTCI